MRGQFAGESFINGQGRESGLSASSGEAGTIVLILQTVRITRQRGQELFHLCLPGSDFITCACRESGLTALLLSEELLV